MVTAAKKTPRKAKQCPVFNHADIARVPVERLKPSPENVLLYKNRSTSQADFRRFVQSIKETGGVQAPLLISIDWYVISGHQRLAGAKEARFPDVPCIMLPLRRSEHTSDEWLAILREHNTGREKTLDERIMENLVDINPDDAMDAVVDEQVKRSKPRSTTVYVPSKIRTRARITNQTRAFAEAIKGILTGVLKESLPVPERAIHYRLLPLDVRTSNGKKGFVYKNDKRSVKALSDMLTRLRFCGEVPWSWICDDTRPVARWGVWSDAALFLGEKLDKLYAGFARDLMQSQGAYYVIVLEKLTIKGFIDKVAARYTIPTVTLRGNSGADARYQLAERFKESGKRSLVLFVLTDCDPAGDSICESTVHSLRDEFGIEAEVKGVRVAITHEQADKYGVAGAVEIKKSSVSPKFIRRHGRRDCYELEAVPPEVLAGWLDEHIRGNIDVESYNHEVAEQAKDVAKIQATRTATLEVIRTREQSGDDELPD